LVLLSVPPAAYADPSVGDFLRAVATTARPASEATPTLPPFELATAILVLAALGVPMLLALARILRRRLGAFGSGCGLGCRQSDPSPLLPAYNAGHVAA
jgi:hypothetical protein